MSRWQLKVSADGRNDYALFLVLKDSRPKSVDERWNVFMPPESAKRLLRFQETRRCPAHGHVHVAIVVATVDAVLPSKDKK